MVGHAGFIPIIPVTADLSFPRCSIDISDISESGIRTAVEGGLNKTDIELEDISREANEIANELHFLDKYTFNLRILIEERLSYMVDLVKYDIKSFNHHIQL